MARIRTIKPELPQSESMGKVRRDARLLFILMWTLADDSGRLRGSSRMLASLLFPYDDDAPGLIDGWVAELVAEGCIDVYSADGSTYIQIAKWLNHQKIDKPSPSKIPPFDESSRILANVRGGIKDQGPKDQGLDQGVEGTVEPPEKVGEPETARAITAVDLSIAMRKAGMQTQPADPRLIALAEQGIAPETVTAACEEAKRTKPNQRIGAGYIFAILERWAADAAALKVAGASAPKSSGGAWWATDATIIAKGFELKLAPLPGESMQTFKGRIQATIDNDGKPPVQAMSRISSPVPIEPKGVKPAGLDLKALVGRSTPGAA